MRPLRKHLIVNGYAAAYGYDNAYLTFPVGGWPNEHTKAVYEEAIVTEKFIYVDEVDLIKENPKKPGVFYVQRKTYFPSIHASASVQPRQTRR